GGPWVRLDPGSWARAELSTDDLDQAGATALRDTFGIAGDRSTWIAPPEVTPEALRAAVEAGAEAVVIDGKELQPVDPDDFPVTLTRPFRTALDADGDRTVATLAADGTVAAHHASTSDSVLAAHRTLADLAVLALDDPAERRVAVLRLDDDAATDVA